MLEGLDAISWEDLQHMYGSAVNVPNLLRQLFDSDEAKRLNALDELYNKVLHQGSRSPVTPYLIPFIIELCANSLTPDRQYLLYFWGHAITGYFGVRERPHWGDGEKIYDFGEVCQWMSESSDCDELHQIYQESLKGRELLFDLLNDNKIYVRAGAVRVLASMPTIAELSVPKLETRFNREISDNMRAGIAFALGELGASTSLWKILAQEQFSATKCMVVCQLARIDPQEALIEPLLEFISQPLNEYRTVVGASGNSTDDAAFSISYLPRQIQQQAIPAICQRLKNARSFDTMPLVQTLLCATFERSKEALTKLTDLQNLVLSQMLITDELWSIGNLIYTFPAYGLPYDKKECAKLVGIEITEDKALTELRSALAFAEMDFLKQAREGIIKALEIDSTVFKRVPAPEECWLLYAKAFAEVDSKRSLYAFRRAFLIDAGIVNRISPTWALADLLKENDF